MKRPRAFHPRATDLLEARVVLSQVYFSPVTGIIATGKPIHAEVAPNAQTPLVHVVSQTKLANGQVKTIDESSVPGALPGTFTSKVIHEPDGTTETESETATSSGLTTNFTNQITLPDGARQTETGTDVKAISSATLLPDGTLQPASRTGNSWTTTTTFNHVITQPGLGTETIAGTTVQGSIKNQTLTFTSQEVTHFDGSQAAVNIRSVERNGITTTHQTMTLPGGATTIAVSTTKVLSLQLGNSPARRG